MEQKVTPWEVRGKIDYDKLIKEFGVSKIDNKLINRIKKFSGDVHHFLRRGIFFAHRDMNFILDEFEKGNKFYLYTGRAPSGHVHIGHLVPWMFTKWLQDKFDVELYFQFPDEEKFLFKKELEWEDAQKFLYENMLDVIAVGFNPNKTHFLIDTKHANLMYPEAIKVAKKITFSTVKATFGLKDNNNLGEIFYTSMQTVPGFIGSILNKKKIPCLIPHAIDQDPHFRISRDVIPKMGYYKPASIQCKFLPGLGGQDDGKMSSSEANTSIYTTDDPETVKKKVMKYAFSGGQPTIEEHRKKGGNPEIDVAYQWLTFFEESDQKLEKIHDDYKKGKLLSGELKQILIDKLNKYLKDHQERRKVANKLVDKFILKT